jgi:benzodiazapine receptor
MRIATLLATALSAGGAAAIGSAASRSSIDTWYRRLRKPGYVPPNVVFPVAWTSLYTDIAVTSASALDRLRAEGSDPKIRAYVAALSANLVLNASWSWLFYKWHKLGPAAVAAAALTASSADLARRTAEAHSRAGLALAPYPLWCGFATVMSTDIWRLNR